MPALIKGHMSKDIDLNQKIDIRKNSTAHLLNLRKGK